MLFKLFTALSWICSVSLLHCNAKVSLYNASVAQEQFPGADIIQLSLKRPHGIYQVPVSGPSGAPMRVGFIDHNILALRKEWSAVAAVRNVISAIECDMIILAARDYAARNGGWMTRRHVDYPTTDFPLKVLFPEQMANDIYGILGKALFPKYEEAFGVNASQFFISDLFVAKYDSSGKPKTQSGLEAHRDNSPWSFVVSLNENYEGGGTYMVGSNEVYRVATGHSIIFNGKNQHGAAPVTNGVRYILAGFVSFGGALAGSKTPAATPAPGSATAPVKKSSEPASMLNFDMDLYDPAYDGYGAESGFRSGDVIVGIDRCEHLTASEISALQRTPVDGDHSAEAEGSQASLPAGVSGDDDSGERILHRQLVAVDGDMDPAEWMDAIRSCEELLASADNVTMVVARQKH